MKMNRVDLFLTALSFVSLCPLAIIGRKISGTPPPPHSKEDVGAGKKPADKPPARKN